jgi:Na+/H+ antiporter NhaA
MKLGGESLEYWINDGFDHLLLLIGLELERNL